jgi:hypothetical protein
MDSPKTEKRPASRINAFIKKIYRLEKRLDLLNIIGKVMPVIFIACGSLIWSFSYLSLHANIPESTIELPVTGEEIPETENFVILYPENGSSISLPDIIIGKAVEGYLKGDEKITFYIQKDNEEPVALGIAEDKGDGYYEVSWTEGDIGNYSIYAQIETTDGYIENSAVVIMNVI